MGSNTLNVEMRKYIYDRNDGEVICNSCETKMTPSNFIVSMCPEIRIYECSCCGSFKDVING